MNQLLEEIIDELNPNYCPVSDEECFEQDEKRGHFYRYFEHIKSGRQYLIKWTVIFGTPETVQTIFADPVELSD